MIQFPSLSYKSCHAKTGKDGKPGISVEQHLQNVASVCHILKRQLPPSLHFLADAAIKSASVHDVGKVSPGFQLKYFRNALVAHLPEFADRPAGHFETDHAHVGACALWSHTGADDPFLCPVVAQIAAMHHGRVKCDPKPRDSGSALGGPAWSRERKRLIQKMEGCYGALHFTVPSNVQKDFIAGMVTISDWIGSDESFFPPTGFPGHIDIESVARSAVSACGLSRPTVVSGLSFQDIFGFPPFEIQERFGTLLNESNGSGIYVLEAPMGTGKTEAALYAAYRLMAGGRNSGLFFGLPTRLTSERIHERIDAFLKKICSHHTAPRLAHGTAWLKSFRHPSFEKGGEAFLPGNAWFNPRKRALLHPFVVGTVDQALMSVLRVKHHFVRTFGLAGKVVILDEVHSYDGYTGTLIETMASQLAHIGCSVIILSATLTGERRAAFFKDTSVQPENKTADSSNKLFDSSPSAPYPLMSGGTFSESAFPPAEQTYDVAIVDFTHQELAKHAVQKAMDSHCVLIIANTVAKAQAWYDAVLAEAPEGAFPIGLLHSKFPGFQRAEIEDIWMKRLGKEEHGADGILVRPKGAILIATQVVEQSVDIDADYLITALAPTDMLLQRMGRQWRHPRTYRPRHRPETLIVSGDPDAGETVDVVLEAFGTSNCHVYAPWVLWRTRDVWKSLKSVKLPGDIRTLLEATYEMPALEEATSNSIKSSLMGVLYDKFKEMRDALECKARANLASVTAMPVGEDHEACATRYSDLPTTQALLVRKIDSTGNQAKLTLLSGERVVVNASQPNMAVTAKLHLNLITIPTWLIRRIDPPKTPPFLKKHFYEATPVLLWDEISGELALNDKSTDFRYSAQKGFFRAVQSESMSSDEGKEPVDYLSDYEAIDLFDKSKFDW